jgi:hypothetical protein
MEVSCQLHTLVALCAGIIKSLNRELGGLWYWYGHFWNKEHLASARYKTWYPDQPAHNLITVLTMLPHIIVVMFHPN